MWGTQMVLFQKYGLESKPIFKYFNLTNYEFQSHLHRAFEIVIVKQGTANITIEQISHHLSSKKTNCAVIFPNQVHSLYISEESEATIVLFSPELVGSFSEQYINHVPESPTINIQLDFDTFNLSNIYLIKSVLYNLLGNFVKQSTFITQKTSSKLEMVFAIIQYINLNYSNECTLELASSKIGYNYEYLSKLFNNVMQESYSNYLNNFRISKARELLKSTDHTMTEIAYKIGYKNLRSFNRNFKSINSMSPQEYRKSNSVNRLYRININDVSGEV